MEDSVSGAAKHSSVQPVPHAWREYVRSFAPLRALFTRAPARQFHVVSFFVLLGGMIGIGWWLSQQIEQRVINYTVEINTRYIESIVTPLLQDLNDAQAMSPADIKVMDDILNRTPVGSELAAFIIWGANGHVLYSSDVAQIGHVYAPDPDLDRSFAGAVTWEINGATENPHIPPQTKSKQLLAMYSPVRLVGESRVIAVAEFYQAFDPIEQDIARTQRQAWLVIGSATLLMYLMLFGFVQRTSNTIVQQETILSAQVLQLTALLKQNHELRDRMQQATHRAATLNERVLRRISADLHDGPLQDLGASILHFDRVAADYEQYPERPASRHAAIVQRSLGRVIHEIRAICSGLGLPQLNASSGEEIVAQVVKHHEQRSGTEVRVECYNLPTDLIPSIKVTLYRILQEGLSNAVRHGQGIDQHVVVAADELQLTVQIADGGPGFDVGQILDTGSHLGLAGMRDRVESLGGIFGINSAPGKGTQIRISLPLSASTNSE
jgi:signal transduction histidine kinase